MIQFSLISYQIFSNANHTNIVLRTASLDLLFTSISLCYDLGEIPLEELLLQTIAYIQSPFKLQVGSDFFQFLIENFEAAQQYGLEIITPLIEDWRQTLAMAQDEDDENEADYQLTQTWDLLLDNINIILNSLSNEALQGFVELILNTAIEVIDQYPNDGCNFLSVVSTLASKLPQLPEEFGELYQFLVTFIERVLTEGLFCRFTYIADIFSSIILKLPGFAENDENVQNVIEICNAFGTSEVLEYVDKSSSLVILSALISKRPNAAAQIFEAAKSIYLTRQDADQMLDTSMIYAMTYAAVAALSVSNGSLLEQIPEQLIEQWITYSYDPEREEIAPIPIHSNCPLLLRDLNVWAIALIYLALAGNSDALRVSFYIIAEMNRKINIKQKRKVAQQQEVETLKAEAEHEAANEDDDEEDIFEEEEDIFDDREQIDDDTSDDFEWDHLPFSACDF